jgi:membrane-bound lytic murein transglycosylase D
MSPRLVIAFGLAIGAVATIGAVWQRSFGAAWRAFLSPELVEPPPPALVAPPRVADDRSAELDQKLADDFMALTEHHPDDELADLRPEELPVPISRRTLRYVRFFTTHPGGRRAFEVMYRRAGRHRVAIDYALRSAGLPADLVWLAAVESGFEPGAVSPRGAVGIWQFMPGTGREYGLVIGPYIDERRSPRRSTEAAVLHLRDLWEELGEIDLAMAAYNAGRLRVQNAMDELARRRDEARLPPMRITVADLAQEGLLPSETADYVPKITAVAIVASHLERFGMTHLVPDEREATSPVVVPAETRLSTIARAASLSLEELRRLNPELLRERLPAGSDFEVQLPADRLNHALVTLPVYLEEDRRGAPMLADEPPSAVDLPVVPLPAGAPAPALVFDFPALGSGGRVEPTDPLRSLFGHGMPIVRVGTGPLVGVSAPTRVASHAESLVAEALAGTPAAAGRALGSGIALRVRRDATAKQVAITLALGDERVSHVVAREDLDLGLAFAAGRLAIMLEGRHASAAAVLRARLNRHRRVALESLPGGDAWLALGDALFPHGDPEHGRIVDPRGVDAEWQRDRLLLADLDAEGATIDVAGAVEPDLVHAALRSQIAQLGIGIAGRLPSPPLEASRHLAIGGFSSRLLFGWRGAGRRDGAYAATMVALEILAGKKRSRLAAALEGHAVNAVLDGDEAVSALAIEVEIRSGAAAAEIEERLRASIAALAEGGPDRVELEYAKAMAQIRVKNRAEREQRGGVSATRLVEARDPGATSRLLAALDRVDAAAVQRVLRGELDPVVVLVAPTAGDSIARR